MNQGIKQINLRTPIELSHWLDKVKQKTGKPVNTIIVEILTERKNLEKLSKK